MKDVEILKQYLQFRAQTATYLLNQPDTSCDVKQIYNLRVDEIKAILSIIENLSDEEVKNIIDDDCEPKNMVKR